MINNASSFFYMDMFSWTPQVSHYTEYIKRNPEWEFSEIFADEGISGTNTKKRIEFIRMIEDCMAGKVTW